MKVGICHGRVRPKRCQSKEAFCCNDPEPVCKRRAVDGGHDEHSSRTHC
jgi:hypothetical protein